MPIKISSRKKLFGLFLGPTQIFFSESAKNTFFFQHHANSFDFSEKSHLKHFYGFLTFVQKIVLPNKKILFKYNWFTFKMKPDLTQ